MALVEQQKSHKKLGMSKRTVICKNCLCVVCTVHNFIHSTADTMPSYLPASTALMLSTAQKRARFS